MHKLVYSDKYEIDLGEHPFNTSKYRLLKEKLLSEGIAKARDFISPKAASAENVLLVHQADYLRKLENLNLSSVEIFTLEMPISKEVVEAALIHCKGTELACKLALKNTVGIHLGGGWHHAFPDHGEGFCVLNDMACAVRKLQTAGIQRVLIVDCDLHQGNGNAYIFRDDPNVFTFSIHQQHLYPVAKSKSDLDIGLEAGISDEKYLNLLESNVPHILDDFKPEFILYQAGADPYKEDRLGNLNLSIEGLQRRDEFIRNIAIKQDIPLGLTLGGGYAYKLEDTVQIHFNTVKVFLK